MMTMMKQYNDQNQYLDTKPTVFAQGIPVSIFAVEIVQIFENEMKMKSRFSGWAWLMR